MKKTLSILIALLVLSLVPTSLFAQELLVTPTQAHALLETPSITDHQKQVLRDWVLCDHQSRQFTIKESAEKVLNPDDFQLLEACASATNINLSNANFSAEKAVVCKSGHQPNYFSYRNYSEGETRLRSTGETTVFYLSKEPSIMLELLFPLEEFSSLTRSLPKSFRY